MKNIRYILICILLPVWSQLSSQQVIIKADTVIGAPGDSVTVGISYANLSDVGSVTLYLSFNGGILKWGRALNWDAGVDNGFNFANASGNTLAVTCLNPDGFSGNQGKLVDLRFKYQPAGGLCPLIFQAGCEITDLGGNPVSPAPQYVNGVVASLIRVSPAATPGTVCQGSSAQLAANASGMFGIYSFLWASEPSGFSSTEPGVSVTPDVTTRYFVTATYGTYSDTGSVLVTVLSTLPPDPVASMFPADGTTGLSNPVTLSWAPAANATHYDLYYWPESGTPPTTPQYAGLTQISKSVTGFMQGTTYNWKVVSKNACFQTTGPVSSFTMLAYPDLHVTQVTASAAYAGQPIEISWTVKNDGLGATTTPLWYDRVWVSPDIEVRVGEPNDFLLGTFPNISYLAPGESYTQTQTFTLPLNMIGTYYIFVVTDALDALFISWPGGVAPIPYSPPPYIFSWTHGGSMVNVVPEATDNGSTSDNFFYKEINLITPPLPDLKVLSILKPATIFSGQQATVTWTVLNNGDATTNAGSWHDRIYLTQDTALEPSTATLLGTFQQAGPLEPDSIYTKSAIVTIPNYILGDYFLYVTTDIYNTVFEHVYEANNVTRSDTLKIFLTPPPDLFVSAIDIPASTSIKENTEFKFTVINQGATATTAGYWTDAIYLSQSPDWDPAQASLLALRPRSGNLASFASYSVQAIVPIPPEFSGAWYVYVKTDINNQVFEYNNENNNISRSDATMLFLNPDLVSEHIAGPATDSADAPVSLSWYDKNAGPGNLVNSGWTDRLYLSLNAVFDPGSAVLFDSLTCNFAIPAGDSLLRQKTCHFPDVSSGDYYLYVVSDARNQVHEGMQENNNTGRSAGTTGIFRADLEVTAVSGDDAAQSGLPVSLTTSHVNNGPGKVTDKHVTDKLFLCPGPVFDPSTAILLSVRTYLCNTLPGNAYTLDWNAVMPEGISGTFHLACLTDATNTVKEGSGEANNLFVSPTPFVVTNGPWADLEPTDLSCTPAVIAGNPITVTFTIANTGTKQTPVNSWKDRIYRTSSPAWDSAGATLLKTIDRIEPLKVDSAYTVTTTIQVPSNHPAGQFYLYVLTDALNQVFEYTDEENNASTAASLQISAYPLDLAMTTASILTDTLQSGAPFQFTYQVDNVGPVPTTAASWYDALYLSADTLFSPATDIPAGKWTKPGPLAPGNNYTLTRMLNVPNGLDGAYYLIGVTDTDDANKDIQPANNFLVLLDTVNQAFTLEVELTPPPDLVIDAFTSPAQVTAGQAFWIHFTVSNQGVGDATGTWKERLYLSQDFEVNTGDINLGAKTRTMVLHPEESYSDSMEVTVLQNLSANYILILKTDADGNIYEHLAEGNNTQTGFLVVAQAPPVDLAVHSMTFPPAAVVGETVTIGWEVRNLGANTAQGNLKDGIYLSQDTVQDASDLLWSVFQDPVSIPPGGSLPRSVDLEVPGLPLGDYYVIIRTDMTNAFLETDETNNRTASESTVNLDFESLELEVTTSVLLPDLQPLFYKLEIHDTLAGETFLLTLKGDSVSGNNEIYASRGQVPSRIHYQYRHRFHFEGNQELVIPSLSPGMYYFLVTGNTTVGNAQDITLKPEILSFELRSIDASQGGNLGNVSVLITGSKFTPQTTVSLVRDTVEIDGSDVVFVNPSLIIASFGLYSSGNGSWEWDYVEVPYGFYDVVARKPDGSSAVLEDGFEVVHYLQPELIANIQYPASVRPDRFFTMSIQFANTGNADIDIPVRSLLSLYGAPIGFNSDDLAANLHDLLLEFREPGGPPDMLRPGAVSEIRIHCKSTHRLVFKLVK